MGNGGARWTLDVEKTHFVSRESAHFGSSEASRGDTSDKYIYSQARCPCLLSWLLPCYSHDFTVFRLRLRLRQCLPVACRKVHTACCRCKKTQLPCGVGGSLAGSWLPSSSTQVDTTRCCTSRYAHSTPPFHHFLTRISYPLPVGRSPRCLSRKTTPSGARSFKTLGRSGSWTGPTRRGEDEKSRPRHLESQHNETRTDSTQRDIMADVTSHVHWIAKCNVGQHMRRNASHCAAVREQSRC